jgi:Mrp family chromosome partitioning ATPase
VREIRHPRLADAVEAEDATGIRVLAVVRPHARHPERARRSVDREMSAHIDPGSDAYRMVYLHLAGADERIASVVVTGDDPAVAAIVAANVAAAAAFDARSVLLVDASSLPSAIASLLRVRDRPGFAQILDGDADWAETVVPATVGRERTLDVIPGGAGAGSTAAADDELVRTSIARLARRYDLVVVFARGEDLRGRSLLPASDVVLCSTVASTPIADLALAIAALRAGGAVVRGVVLWDAPPPSDVAGPAGDGTPGAEALVASPARRGR